MRQEMLLLVIGIVHLCSEVESAPTIMEWAHHIVLDRQQKYHLYWTAEDNAVTFEVAVATRGYVGFGLSTNGGMAGSDIVIGWISDAGEVTFHDRHARGEEIPKIDSQQDWELLAGWENETHTSLRFRRELETCDDQDIVITNNTARVIFAYHPEDPESLNGLPYHGWERRGVRSVMLLQPEVRRDLPTEGVRYWDIVSPNVSIADDSDTTYWCKVIKAPLLNRKHHVIKIEPMVQPGNEGYVHHIVLYRCLGASGMELEPYVHHHGHECYVPNTPAVFSKCESIYTAWGVGGETMVMPEHAGLPLGDKGNLYFMMEIHYDNKAFHSGVVDRSGFRVYFTPELRQYDAMTLMIGASIDPCVIVPPGTKDFVIAGHSDPACLSPAIPKGGIKLFAVFLHSHLLGRKMVLRHFRGNIELPPVVVDKNYDFNYQEYRYLPKETTVLAGDHLVVECTYDSSQRNFTTFGGLGTRQEMCLAFVLYYPRIARARALSSATCRLVMGLAGIESFVSETGIVESPAIAANQTYYEYFTDNPWEGKFVDVVEDAMRFGYHKPECYLGNGERLQMPSLISYPKDFKPYLERESGKCKRVQYQRSVADEAGRLTGECKNGSCRPSVEMFCFVLWLFLGWTYTST